MAEPKKPAGRAAAPPPAVPPRPADAGAQLEELNDQLARFLQHADQLVDEWARFGADVRRTVDGEVGRIDQAVTDAAERAVREASAQVDRLAAERVERVIEQSVGRLRGELERAPRGGGGGTSAASAATATALPLRQVLAAVVLADLLLVVLLVMVWRRDPAPAAGAAVDRGHAADLRPVVAPEVTAACAAVVAGTADAAAIAQVLDAGTAACGAEAAAVGAELRARLAPPPAIDAGAPVPVDAAPPDARRPRGR